MALEFRCALRVLCVDACVEQATPRAWEGNQNGNIRGCIEDIRDLVVSTFGGEIIVLGDIDDFARFGVRIRPLHV